MVVELTVELKSIKTKNQFGESKDNIGFDIRIGSPVQEMFLSNNSIIIGDAGIEGGNVHGEESKITVLRFEEF